MPRREVIQMLLYPVRRGLCPEKGASLVPDEGGHLVVQRVVHRAGPQGWPEERGQISKRGAERSVQLSTRRWCTASPEMNGGVWMGVC